MYELQHQNKQVGLGWRVGGHCILSVIVPWPCQQATAAAALLLLLLLLLPHVALMSVAACCAALF
jgi:hypothetical protein